jgi:hypothetical protein
MGIRKNAKFLSSTEKENFVRACVLMKADIVNGGAPPASQYSVWDQYNAIHKMIQNAFAPGSPTVNFGHGGTGSYSFFSWHRYFLYRFEQDLQSYVPGVMIPYWDWTDPTTLMTNTFMGPNGVVAAGNVIQQGYFAVDKPGSGVNATPLPGWWPATLPGWRLPGMFPATHTGGLRRRTGPLGLLPSVTDLQEALAKSTYASFQAAMEAGTGISSGHMLHNDLHGWLGGGNATTGGHLRNATISPHDPFFYLHHCNVDRLWAMWQMDGHQTEYPTSGGDPHHHRNDIMYPWTGGAAGYGTNDSIASAIPMPNFGPTAKHNVDTLDFRNAFGYTYDTIPIVGIALDRTGSMLGLTPDPMDASLPDVSKWEAAKRGVSAFLQDCETVQHSAVTYVMAGVKTFRTLAGNQFDSVFGAPNYGLIKTGTPFSRATFDANISPMTPGGNTPLADALTDVQNTLVEAPFAGNPTDEQRYIAFLTDGILTSGSPLSSIPDGSFSRTAIFGMGFGTGADVDYPTIASIVAKGKNIAGSQVFHGENAGTIDKFYSTALASAIGFTVMFDPVLQLFAGEHTHVDFMATSADDCFFITVQGMDFTDKNWSYMLHGPNGQMLYGNESSHDHMACNHCCPPPTITSSRSNGRLSMVIQKGNTGKDCWVGNWQLMISYKAKQLDKMMMPELGEMLFPVAAGPIRGPRYARLLVPPGRRTAPRNIHQNSAHSLDVMAASTNSNGNEACTVVVNIYSRTTLKIDLRADNLVIKAGEEIKINFDTNLSVGSVQNVKGFARLISPAFNIFDILPRERVEEIIRLLEKRRYSPKLDIALILANFEKGKKDVQFVKDTEVKLVSHDGSALHMHVHDATVPGSYHFGVIVNGLYFPGVEAMAGEHDHHHAGASEPKPLPEGEGEEFSRLLNITVGVVN